MIEFVFLDLDDTIFDFSACERIAISRTLSSMDIEPTDSVCSLYSEINDLHWKRLERGELTRDQVKLQRFECLFRELGVSADAEHARRLYEVDLSRVYAFKEGAIELLKVLQEKYRLFVVSNGITVVQNGRISASGIAGFFEDIFLSEAVGYVKPQKEFFDVCFSRIKDFDPSKSVIVGDSLTSDIQGGRNAGILTCWFNPKWKATDGTVIPDVEFRTLAELPALLERL